MWHEDPRTKWTFVLSAYSALNMRAPPKVHRAAARAAAALGGTARPRKRLRVAASHNPRPVSHYCPISQEIMSDPVVCPDGHSYEKEQLTAWLRIKRTSPITQQTIPTDAEFPRNHALRHAIEDFATSSSQ